MAMEFDRRQHVTREGPTASSNGETAKPINLAEHRMPEQHRHETNAAELKSFQQKVEQRNADVFKKS